VAGLGEFGKVEQRAKPGGTEVLNGTQACRHLRPAFESRWQSSARIAAPVPGPIPRPGGQSGSAVERPRDHFGPRA
jgi:hypothetical protein